MLLCRTAAKYLLSGLFLALILGVSSPSWAKFGDGLDEESLNALKKQWDTDPGAIVNNDRVLRQLSAQQISDLMEYKDTTHYSYLHVEVIKGEDFGPTALGNPTNRLSVMVAMNNRMQPIPFQIDEVDKSGLTFIPSIKKYPIDGKEGVLDKQDEVVFMYRDANFQRYEKGKTILVRGKVLKEIELNYEDRKPRYAYLVLDNSRRSNVNYVSMDVDAGRFNSTYFTMSWDPNNFSQIRNVIPKVGPEQGKNVLDNLYFEVSTGIFNKNVRFSLNSKKNIFAEIQGIKQGPIRVNVLVKGRVKYVGIPSMPYYLNMIFTEQSVSFRSRTTVDGYKYAKYAVAILKEPGIYVSMDFHNIDGAKIRFESIADSPEVPTVDGKMSPIENRINEERLPGSWFWIDSGQGWSIYFSNNWPIIEGGLFDAFLEGMSFHMVYEDDITKTTDYERFPGGEPRVGVRGEGIPKVAMELVSAISDIPISEAPSLGALVDFVQKTSEEGKLKKLDEIVTKVLVEQRNLGKINNSKELADAFIADFNLVGVKVHNRDKMNKAIRTTIEKLDKFENFNIGKSMKDFKAASKEVGLDLNLIHYAPRDNVLWFPDSLGAEGPDGFRKEINNPPAFTLHDI